MRAHTQAEARAVLEEVHEAQELFLEVLGHRMVHAADEYYLLAGVEFPVASDYDGFGMHEDGIGMARAFEMEFRGEVDSGIGVRPGFFDWVDAAPAHGYRVPRTDEAACGTARGSASTPVSIGVRRDAPVGVLTGALGARVLRPLIGRLEYPSVRVIEVENRFFGGNTGVTGLMVGEDVARTLESQPRGDRYLLPDVCLSRGVFLDGVRPDELPRPVEVVPTDGVSLREVLEPHRVADVP
ncbi:MAG: DUF512 domain-containing protein [Microthrixaceae bacterium]